MSDGKLIFDTKIDTSGLKDGLKEIKNVAGQNLDVVGSGFEKTGGKLTKYLTKPALVAGGALAGLTLGKGLKRLTDIDTAKAKLEGLGYSAKDVEGIMDSALESVKGTAFGLGEAATTASSAVASGIKPGKELTRYLSLVGDAAAIAGTDMNEMGSVFNKVAANGKMSAEELNMLTDRGIPALQLLADASGKTVEEVRADMAAGKIDLETFLTAIEDGMGGAAKIMGSKSFTAAAANIMASLSRIGANFLDAGGKGGGFFSQLKPLMAQLADWLENVEEKATDWGVAFGNAFAKVSQFIISMPNGLKAVLGIAPLLAGPMITLTGKILTGMSALNQFKTAANGTSTIVGILTGKISASQVLLGTFGNKVKAVGNAVKSLSKGGISGLTTSLARLNPTLKTTNTLYGSSASSLYKQTSGFKAAVSGISSYVTSIAKKTLTTGKDTAANLLNAISTSKVGNASKTAATKVLAFAAAHKTALLASLGLAGGIAALAIYMSKSGKSADELANDITAFADKAADMITKFANELPGMIDSILPAITAAVEALVEALPLLIPALLQAGIMLFMTLVDSLSQVIEPLVAALPQLINAIVAILPTLIPMLIQAGITLFMGIVQAIPQIIPALVAAIPQIVNAFVSAIPALIPAILQAAITLFMAIVQAIPQIIVALVAALPKIIAAIVKGLLSGLKKIFTVGVQLLKQLWSGISSWAGSLGSKVVSLAKSLPGKIKSGLGSLLSVGRDWVKGLWNGISNVKDWIISKIKGFGSSCLNAIKDFFGINSPSKVMAEIGNFLGLGLADGIVKSTKKAVAAAKTQAGKVLSAYGGKASLAAEVEPVEPITPIKPVVGTLGRTIAMAEPQSSTINQTVNINQPVQTPIETARAIKREARLSLAGV